MTVVHNKSELDAALAVGAELIEIRSDSVVGLNITDSGFSRVVARDSSRVEARDSSHVEAWDSSQVVARGSSRVVAWHSSRVEAWHSSQVEAWDSSQVEAWHSSRVEARDSSQVEAWDSSQVVARGSSRVVARGSSRVEAAKYVAVHLHSRSVTLTGDGPVIDMTQLDPADPQTWVDLNGGKVKRGRLTVYKGVNAGLRSGHGVEYPIGKIVTCQDWNTRGECGGGLHFSPSPAATDVYGTHHRYLECTVKLSEIVPLGDKIKAKSCRVVREVDRFGDPIQVQS